MSREVYYNQKTGVYKVSGGRMGQIIKLLPKHAGRVLDIGCGRGELASKLKELGWQVTGLDISQEALKKANENLSDSFCFDIEREIWPEELVGQKFHLIVASEVVEHVFFPSQLLGKLKGLLSDKGKMIVTIPNLLFWKNRLKILLGNFRYASEGLLDFGHIRFFTIKTSRELFNEVGLNIEKEAHFYPNLYKRGLNFLGKLLPGFFAYQMIFLLSNGKE